MKTFANLLLFPIFIFQSAIAAQTYIPNSSKVVVAKWEVTEPVYISPEHIAELIREAKYPGNSANFAIAKNLLQQQKTDRTNVNTEQSLIENTEYIYQKAVVAQYFHQFEDSNKLLNIVIQQRPEHTNAILLKSNMHLLLGEFEQALQACTRLLGLAEQAIVAACGNYAKAQKGNVKQNLDSLMGFLRSQETTSSDVSIWLAEIQASLAKDIGAFDLASTILKPFLHGKVPVSFWVLWADIQIALNAPENVLTALGTVVRQNKNKDDALLLRLAVAEKQMQLSHKVWLPQATARIDLRERRQDTEHAFDIALYYLYIKEDAETAHKWAKVNWQQAKLREDAELLRLTENELNNSKQQTKLIGQLLTYKVNAK